MEEGPPRRLKRGQSRTCTIETEELLRGAERLSVHKYKDTYGDVFRMEVSPRGVRAMVYKGSFSNHKRIVPLKPATYERFKERMLYDSHVQEMKYKGTYPIFQEHEMKLEWIIEDAIDAGDIEIEIDPVKVLEDRNDLLTRSFIYESFHRSMERVANRRGIHLEIGDGYPRTYKLCK